MLVWRQIDYRFFDFRFTYVTVTKSLTLSPKSRDVIHYKPCFLLVCSIISPAVLIILPKIKFYCSFFIFISKQTKNLREFLTVITTTKNNSQRLWGLGSISPTYLCTALTPVAPKSVRFQSSCQYLFTLLGSTGTKAALRTLMKLTPDVIVRPAL